MNSGLKSRFEDLERRVRTKLAGGNEVFLRDMRSTVEQMKLSVGGTMSSQPTRRWRPLRPHDEQARFWASDRRFQISHAGRRSGKTEIIKRKVVIRALSQPFGPEGHYKIAVCAPTKKQVLDIYLSDFKQLIPKRFVKRCWEGGKWELINGVIIELLSLDEPARIEGQPWNLVVMDEFANMKARTWQDHVRPGLGDTGGEAWFIGVPEGRNHYYQLVERAKTLPDWAVFHWFSEDILPPEEIEELRASLDEVTFEQEMRGSFTVVRNRVYYAYDRNLHSRMDDRVFYNPNKPLILCFDFNVEPGVCAYVQEQAYRGNRKDVAPIITAAFGEVWIPRDSNTPTVCRKILSDWGGGKHKGEVHVYGDPAGGARSTKSDAGSDIDIIRQYLKPEFGDNLKMRFDDSAPPVKSRIVAVNTRLKTANGKIHALVDPVNAKHLIDDLEGVQIKQGTDGEINKAAAPMLSHISDGFGYYVEKRHPVRNGGMVLQGGVA